MFSASADNSIKAWNLNSLTYEYTLNYHNDAVQKIILSKCQRYILSASQDNYVVIYDLDHKEVYVRLFHDYSVNALDVTKNNSHVITGGMECNLKLWTFDGNYIITLVGGHKQKISSVH